MKLPLVQIWLALACAGSWFFCWDPALAQTSPWTVETSIATRYFVRNFTDPGFLQDIASGEGEPARFSPNRARFFIAAMRGRLDGDAVETELSIYDSEDVISALESEAPSGPVAPRHTLRLASTHWMSFGAAIYNPIWLNDHQIAFVGTRSENSRRVYVFDLDQQSLRALTPEEDIISEAGGGLFNVLPHATLYQTFATADRNSWRDDVASELRPAITRSYFDAAGHIFCCGDWTQLRAVLPGRAPVVLDEIAGGGAGASEPWASHQGDRAVMIYAPREASLQASSAPSRRFMMIDFAAATATAMFEAPAGAWAPFNVDTEPAAPRRSSYAAFWSYDDRHVLLFNTEAPGRTNPSQQAHIVDFDTTSSRVRILGRFNDTDRRVAEARWQTDGRTIAVSYIDSGGRFAGVRNYSYNGQRWSQGPLNMATALPQAEAPSPFTVRILEGANAPPIAVARGEGRDVALSLPDPALAGVEMRPLIPISWTEPSGAQVEAGLILPRNCRNGRPIKLIVQLMPPSRGFHPDGEYGTALASQVLAASGFAVLELPAAGFNADVTADETLLFTPDEGPAQVARLDRAIDELGARNIVNDGPVGLIGFSRMGYYAYYIATHPGRTPIGAFVVHDSINAGWGEYVNLAALGDEQTPRIIERQYGGRSFWARPERWLDAPTFNLQRLTAPGLFNSTNPWALSETAGAFRLARRPIYAQVFPKAEHVLQRPSQRVAAMQSTLDWMRFWLRGERPRQAAFAQRLEEIQREWRHQFLWEAQGHPVGSAPHETPTRQSAPARHDD